MLKSKEILITMEVDDSADSDCELIIDESVVLSSEEDEFQPNRNISEKKSIVVARDKETNWATDFKNIFHPLSISSSDIKDELYQEETNTCNICNETFRYNVGLIYHLEMEHVELKINGKIKKTKKVKKSIVKNGKKNTISVRCGSTDNQKVNKTKVPSESLITISSRDMNFGRTVFKKNCEVCKKSFSNEVKLSKHTESCIKIGLKFQCVYCKLKFGWESKYKKHLFKTHKLNAAVICKQCSSVFEDMITLAMHKKVCDKDPVEDEALDLSMPEPEW